MLGLRTRREENRETRRATIVAIARDAFLDQGYAAVSMSAISTALGGSKGTLWAYFPSKEDLFTAVLDDVIARFRGGLEDALRPGRDCRTTLRDFSERLLTKIVDSDSFRLQRLVIGEGGRFPEIGRIFFARGPQVVLDRLSVYIQGCMGSGDLRHDDPMQAAMTLLQLIHTQHNLRLWGVVDMPDADEIRHHAVRGVDLFMRAYAV